MKSALPTQKIYRGAFNAFAKANPDKDESYAHAVAWSAVKGKYLKQGDKWVMKDGSEDQPRDDHGRWTSGDVTDAEHTRSIASAVDKAHAALSEHLDKLSEHHDDADSAASDAESLEEDLGPGEEYEDPKDQKEWEENYDDARLRAANAASDARARLQKIIDVASKHLENLSSIVAIGETTMKDSARRRSGSAVTRGTFSDVAIIDAAPQRTADGYMKAFARVARTGVQVYKGHELGRPSVDEVRVYRPPNEVFSVDAMRSLANKPMTLHHPRENVSAKNWRHYSIGHTGEDVVRDGDHVRVPLMLCDQAAIDAYEHDGIKQLSVGYSADVRWSPGRTPQGEKFDAVQSGIRANHISMVPDARAGDKATLGDQNRHQLSGQFMHKGSHSMDEKTCPECGEDVDMDEDECPECGHTFGGGQHFGDDNRPTFTCWSCGQRIPDGTEICPLCRESQIAPRDDEIQTQADLENAIKALSRGKLFSANKSRIIKAAKRLGKVQSLPEDWNIAENIGDAHFATVDAHLAVLGRMNVFDKEFSTKRRQKLAKEGKAMPSGGFPIENRADLGRAIQAFGRAGDKAAAKRWIIKRAKELGATKELPATWNVSDGIRGDGKMHLMIDGVLVELSDSAGAVVQKALNGMKQRLADARKRDQDYSSGKTEKTANEAGGGQEYDDEYDGDDDDDDAQEKEMKRGAKQRQEDRRDSRDAKDGVIAGLKKKLADAEAALKPEAIADLVANRQALMDAAGTVLDRNYVYRGKTDAQVRRDAVAASGIDSSKMNDAQVEGAFLTITADGGKQRQSGGFNRMVDGMSRGMEMSDRDAFNQRANMGPRNGVVSPQAMRDAAFADRERYLNTAWQGGRGADVHGHNTNDFRR